MDMTGTAILRGEAWILDPRYNKAASLPLATRWSARARSWTLAEHYQRTRDRAWVEKSPPSGPPVPVDRPPAVEDQEAGRLRPEGPRIRPDAAGRDGRLGPIAYRFFNDAQYCAGLELAAAGLADMGIRTRRPRRRTPSSIARTCGGRPLD